MFFVIFNKTVCEFLVFLSLILNILTSTPLSENSFIYYIYPINNNRWVF